MAYQMVFSNTEQKLLILGHQDLSQLPTVVQGIFGYLDPEFFQSSQFTDKSDVYSFGVVIAELLTGERPIMLRAGQDNDRSLATHFISALDEKKLFEIIDAGVAREGSKDEVNALAILARSCLNLNGRDRPAMKEVMLEIERIRTSSKPKASTSNMFHYTRSIGESNEKFEDDISSTSLSCGR